MSLTEELNRLFEKWEEEIEGHKGKFIRDGIIDEIEWQKTTPKILFIAKEANQSGIQKPGDFREDWINETTTYPFKCRIAEWSYGIINNFPAFDNISSTAVDCREMLKKVAFVNIKKTGGEGNSVAKELEEHFAANLILLKRQIAIINPDIIILGLSFTSHFNNKLFESVEWLKSGYGINIGKLQNTKIIDFYHPSSRNTPNAAYSLLQNVVNSKAFKNL